VELLNPIEAAWNILKANPARELTMGATKRPVFDPRELMREGNLYSNLTYPVHYQRRVRAAHPALSDANVANITGISNPGFRPEFAYPKDLERGPAMYPIGDNLMFSDFTSLDGRNFSYPNLGDFVDQLVQLDAEQRYMPEELKLPESTSMGNPDNIQMIPGNVMQRM
jgi:hypothetical protein